MNCPCCNYELIHEDSYGKYLSDPQHREIYGDIYRCPNHEGFSDEESAMEYLESIGETLESLKYEDWMEVICESSIHHVSGSFYTDINGNLFSGYPC